MTSARLPTGRPALPLEVIATTDHRRNTVPRFWITSATSSRRWSSPYATAVPPGVTGSPPETCVMRQDLPTWLSSWRCRWVARRWTAHNVRFDTRTMDSELAAGIDSDWGLGLATLRATRCKLEHEPDPEPWYA